MKGNNSRFGLHMLMAIAWLIWLVIVACGTEQSEPKHASPGSVSRSSAITEDLRKYISWMKEIELDVPDSLGIRENILMRIDEEPLLYVRLTPEHLIGVFDTTGQFIETVGSSGFGPGELRRILSFQVDSMKTLYLLDEVTNQLYEHNLQSGWLATKAPLKSGIMALEKCGNRFVFFRRANVGDGTYHIQIAENTKDSLALFKEILQSSAESIRTKMIVSNFIACNNAGDVLFTFYAPRVFYVISPDLQLSEIDIDDSVFKASKTNVLVDKFNSGGFRGLRSELSTYSRAISLGFVTDDIFLFCFATGRFAETKFHIQFYSLTARSSISPAIPIEFSIRYIGHNTFACSSFGESTEATDPRFLFTLFKLKVDGYDKKS